MEVSVRGYARDCGWTFLAKEDVSNVRLPESSKWHKCGSVKVQRRKNGIAIRRVPVTMTLNGRYILDVELTKEEVRNLFVETFADASLSEALASLSAALEARAAA